MYGVGLLAGGRMGPEGENHPLTTRRVRAEYADLHTHIISSTYKPAKSASKPKPASPQASKSAKCKQASKQASHSKQASQRTTYNTMKSVMAASTCTMRCHKSSNSIQFTIQTQQLRILLNALFTHLSSVYYADRSLLCTPLVRLVRGGGAYILIFAMVWSFSNFISIIYACLYNSQRLSEWS